MTKGGLCTAISAPYFLISFCLQAQVRSNTLPIHKYLLKYLSYNLGFQNGEDYATIYRYVVFV